ncbi:GNAT family N-acetyltransferase [Schaalia canis]|uniref:GNAT family N-acetyltransferase n=1 Tax=Schaalia canis TaxID=100469 RepID=A0A3P1SJ10_9ACTO|nr:GNAT family N-acetyltransferase [Schaalia canis]RRC96302.1 GNAT family N-acetyltransferase [Schaalia canis]
MTGLAQRLQPPASVAYPGAHLGLRWRQLIPSDGPGIAELARVVEDADEAIHRISPAQIADLMEGKQGEDLIDTIVGVDGEGVIGAVASVRVLRSVEEMAVAVVNALIHPRWRGRGLGRALLFWQDGRARQLLVEHFGADNPIRAQIMNTVDSHMTDRRRLYIAAGFFAKRTFAIMYREIEGSETTPPVKHGYSLLPWNDVNVQEAHLLHREVFTHHYWPEMRDRWWAEAMDECEPRWSFGVVDSKGKLAGYCICARPAERWAATGRTEAYVSLIGVGPEHQGKGLVRSLLGAAVAAAARSGMNRIGLDVDISSPSNAHGIYEHFGFVDERSEVYYAIEH